jgi:hypothetical protein
MEGEEEDGREGGAQVLLVLVEGWASELTINRIVFHSPCFEATLMAFDIQNRL